MTETYRARIPFESLDSLTIGSAGDKSKVYRDELELELPAANLLAAIYPEEPPAVADTTEEARRAITHPVAVRPSRNCSRAAGASRSSSTTSSARRRWRRSCPPCST